MEAWEHDINWQLMIAFSLSNRAITRRTRACGLTPGQPKILQYLGTYDGCSQKQIARGCAVDKSTVAGLLVRMEKDGLIERSEGSDDRRETVVHLTNQGWMEARKAIANAAATDEVALAGLGDAEHRELARLLDAVISNLADA